MLEIHLILVFMIAAAIIAVEVKDLLSGVIAVGAVGIGLSIAFLVLKAPDLAIMQLVVEILSLIILIRATERKDLPFSVSGRWLFNTLSMLVFIVVFSIAVFYALNDIPPFGNPVMRTARAYLAGGAGAIGADNVVAALTLRFRSYDTLGEVVIVMVAVIGALAVARRRAHAAKEDAHHGG